MFVKICGITTEDDGLLAVALGADALGFVFAPSTRQVAVDRARDIVRRLPAEVLTVGVFRDELPDRVVEIVQRAGLGAAQLHGHESAEQTREVRRRIPLVIKCFPAGHPGLSRLAEYGADIIHIEGEKPGSGEVFDWRLAEDAPKAGHRVLLAGGLHPGPVADGIRQVKPWGVDVSSGVEREPGRKDPVKLREFIDAARAAGEEIRPENYDEDGALYDWQDDF